MELAARIGTMAANAGGKNYEELYYAVCKLFSGRGNATTATIDAQGNLINWLYGNASFWNSNGIKKLVVINSTWSFAAVFRACGFEEIEVWGGSPGVEPSNYKIYLGGAFLGANYLKTIRFNDATGWNANSTDPGFPTSLEDLYLPKMIPSMILGRMTTWTSLPKTATIHCLGGLITWDGSEWAFTPSVT